MLDIEFIRQNPDKVKDGIAKKRNPPDLVDQVLELDQRRRELGSEVDDLRARRNIIAKEGSFSEEGKKIKEELKKKEPELHELEEKFESKLLAIPNLPANDVPEGKSEEDNVEVRQIGEPPDFSFKPKDHVELGQDLGIIDFEKASKVSGHGFYFLIGDGALLELALVQYALKFLTERGFTPVITPDLAHERYYVGTGYLPKGPEAQTYVVESSDLGLIATSEVTLAGYHADEVLSGKDLPKLYGGYSHCFRVEAGSYGKYSKGLYRLHQFTKVEMFAFCKPEDSNSLHQKLLGLEEEFWKSLGISYRVIEMCTADLGAQATKKYDLEAWMPGRGDWGEVTSTSNTTDYQTRRLNIKYDNEGKKNFVHTLNGTLVATSRALIAILENNQTEDGSVTIPEVLRPYIGKDKISPKDR